MTFAEIFLLIALGWVLFRILRPVQRRLEAQLYQFFRSKRHRGKGRFAGRNNDSNHENAYGPIIDITDRSKKDH